MKWLKELIQSWMQYRLRRLEMQLESKNKPFDMIAKQTQVLQAWMESFKVTELPTSTLTRQADEFLAEQNREYKERYGVDQNVAESVRNAIKVGAFPELKDIFDNE